MFREFILKRKVRRAIKQLGEARLVDLDIELRGHVSHRIKDAVEDLLKAGVISRISYGSPYWLGSFDRFVYGKTDNPGRLQSPPPTTSYREFNRMFNPRRQAQPFMAYQLNNKAPTGVSFIERERDMKVPSPVAE